MTQVVNGLSLEELGDAVGDAAIGHLDLAFRRLLGTGPGIESDLHFVRIITGKSHPFANFGMLAADVDSLSARRALEPFRACESAVVFYAGHRNEIVDKVAVECGLGAIEPFPAMAVDIDRLLPTPLVEGYSFFRLGPNDEVGISWTQTFADGFGFPVDIGESFKPKIKADDPEAPVQYFAIARNADQKIVATSAVCLHGGVAGVYCVATIPTERGKGLGAYVTAEPLRMVRSLGYRVGVLQASKAGKPVYERLRFGTYGDALMYMKVAE